MFKKIFLGLFILICSTLAAQAQSPQPCQWNYTFVDGVSNATYCGMVNSGSDVTPSVTPLAFGAQCNGTSDDSAPIQNAENFLESSGGGILNFPANKTCVHAATLHVRASGISWIGGGSQAGGLLCETGSNDCIDVIGTSGSHIQGFRLENMRLIYSGLTGGYAINGQYLDQSFFNNDVLTNPYDGINLYVINTATLKNVTITGISGGSGRQCIYYHAPADGSARSDVLNLHDFVCNLNWSGADGIIVDGWANTLNLDSATTILQSNYGLRVKNSAGSPSFYPSFIIANNFNVDGAMSEGVRIEAGSIFAFSNSDIVNDSGNSGQGGNDTYAFEVLEDASGSLTNHIQITNSRIGLSKETAFKSAGRDILVNNSTFIAGSDTPSNTYPAIEIAAASQDVTLTGNHSSQKGSLNDWSNGLLVDGSTSRISATGNYFYNALTKCIQWNGTDSASVDENNACDNPKPYPPANTVSISGAGVTLTAAQAIGPAVLLSGATQNFSVSLPTAATWVAALPNPILGKSYNLNFVNTTAFVATLGSNTGVSAGGTFTIPANGSLSIKVIFTNVAAGSEAISVYQ